MYCRSIVKKTFNPSKNYFETEEIILKRPATDIEVDLANKIGRYSASGALSIFVGMLLAAANAITFGILSELVHIAFAAGAFGGVLLFFIGGIVLARSYFWAYEHKCSEELKF